MDKGVPIHMDTNSNWMLAASPTELLTARNHGLPVACMAYRVGTGPHLFRASMSAIPRGGLMGIDIEDCDGQGEPGGFCQEVFRECAARSFRGIICNFTPNTQQLPHAIVEELGARCGRFGLSLYLTEAYGSSTDKGKVLISSALSGGSLHKRLEEALDRYGANRVALLVEPVRGDFYLPSPTGQGSSLTEEALRQLMEEQDPSTFFSSELCAHYFTYMSKQDGAHFVLFDDGGSIQKKIQLAERLGIRDVILPYGQNRDFLAQLMK